MLKALAPAKINLFLYVGPRRQGGYHPLCSLMEKVSLYDSITLERTVEAPGAGGSGKNLKPEIILRGKGLPPGINTVEKAANTLAAESGAGAVIATEIELKKEIPVAAGLAGGSSDAAAALTLINSSFQLKITRERLHELALSIGADVPFFLDQGTQLAQGVGERLERVNIPFDYAAVIVTPPVEISTAHVYRVFDETSDVSAGDFSQKAQKARDALGSITSVETLAAVLHNDLEAATEKLCPQIPAIKSDLAKSGALGTLMSGSGPSVFGLFLDIDEATAAAARLYGSYGFVRAVKPVAGMLLSDY